MAKLFRKNPHLIRDFVAIGWLGFFGRVGWLLGFCFGLVFLVWSFFLGGGVGPFFCHNNTFLLPVFTWKREKQSVCEWHGGGVRDADPQSSYSSFSGLMLPLTSLTQILWRDSLSWGNAVAPEETRPTENVKPSQLNYNSIIYCNSTS